ncbi:uncharacterized protein YtpQ (UPF0354 family) [Povalibacter uvarum]|uniref:Uncharacterized protein YtpQ (UPF0354 family) n=1 Tax=Povalibacter uvarum TaxID=732238 RepID=A0A841HJ32_9GAMM|nr:DUF1444 family protein [Povalibacter uvarum]MBB6093221.1 uncharacterized protein YtpQ (UPF0354 family) [Povalibacter uvarum]
MLSWRELLGMKPRLEDFARVLLNRARSLDDQWRYDVEKAALHHPRGATINLTNMFLEYLNARRADRKHLLLKYESMLEAGAKEIPKLWGMASQHIYPVVRSVYDRVSLEISSRSGKMPLQRTVSWPLCADIHLRLVFDHGHALAHVDETLLDTWGQTADSIRMKALQNLRALERPHWQLLGDGVYQIVSAVSYEESFLLVDAVIDALPFAATAVVMPANRGVLLSCDGSDDAAIRSLLAHADRSLREAPWPLSGTLLQRRNGEWIEFVPQGDTQDLHQSVQRISMAVTYSDQQTALQEHLGEDVFVATYSLMSKREGDGGLWSWSTWTEGVATLLPETDLVALGRPKPDGSHNLLLVPWSALIATCGHRMRATSEFPARFAVDGFPSEEEWLSLTRAGELIG